ncbi:MAG: NAD-dependent epimerase/dehydratase family protein, partial [Pricia sp.]
GTNFISVMPTNLYGPNDNFDLEKSHVLPALLRKMHLGKALEQNDWETIRRDLERLPIEDANSQADEAQITSMLEKYGIKQADNTVKIEIWGSGRPMREFLWSEDMADACVFIMENRDFEDCYETGTQEIRNTHINIGTGEDVSIEDLALMIKDAVGFTGELYFNTDKPDGTMKKLTDVSKLHDLGWQHEVKLEEGIGRMYKWYLQ